VRVVGYLRVSTSEQAESGLGMDAQRARIEAEADRRGWSLCIVEDPGFSAKDLDRPGIQEALTMLAEGKADALCVAKIDRATRSLLDFAGLMELARKQGWSVIALDLGVDTSTAAGEMLANVLATFAHYERRIIGERTRDALRAAQARGTRLGRPTDVPERLRRRIVRMKRRGLSLVKIADKLNAENVPTARGGARWYPSTVDKVLKSVERDHTAA
jgi:DNA invertase Pin-like site-specific DNA recombinase